MPWALYFRMERPPQVGGVALRREREHLGTHKAYHIPIIPVAAGRGLVPRLVAGLGCGAVCGNGGHDVVGAGLVLWIYGVHSQKLALERHLGVLCGSGGRPLDILVGIQRFGRVAARGLVCIGAGGYGSGAGNVPAAELSSLA